MVHFVNVSCVFIHIAGSISIFDIFLFVEFVGAMVQVDNLLGAGLYRAFITILAYTTCIILSSRQTVG